MNISYGSILNQGQLTQEQTVSTQNPAQQGITEGKQVQFPQNLQELVGKVFKGEITDIRNQFIQITLDNNQIMQARLAEPMNLVIGQQLAFLVKEAQGRQLMIKPMIQNFAQNTTALKALEAAQLPVNEKNAELVKALLEQQMPIDKNSLHQMLRQLTANPGTEMETLVLMNKYKIPVTKENIEQFENFKNYEHRVTKELDSIAENVTKIFESQTGSKQEAAAVQARFLDILSTGRQAEPLELNTVLDQNGREALLRQLSFAELPKELAEEVRQGTATTDELWNQLQKTFTQTDQVSQLSMKELGELLNGKEYQSLVKAHLQNQWFLKPHQLMKNNAVKPYYEQLYEQNEKLHELAEELGKTGEALAKQTSGLKQNVNFMNQMNQIFPYVQLPLKFHEQNVHSELYVYTNRRNRQNPDGEVSALLHLDMEQLGTMDVYVAQNRQHISAKFYMEDDSVVSFISANISVLEEKLMEKGFQVSTEVLKKEKELNAVEEFLEKDRTGTGIKRYSFDVRA